MVGAITSMMRGFLGEGPSPTTIAIYIIIIAAIIWVLAILFAYFGGDDKLISLVRAKKITTDDIHRLHNIVDELKIAYGLETMPSIYIVDDQAMNAFAIGCRPNKAAIVVTSGLLANLNRDELQGVIAHEIAHINNRDVLLMILCVSLFDAITLMAWFILYNLSLKDFVLGKGRWLLAFISFLAIVLALITIYVEAPSLSWEGLLLIIVFVICGLMPWLPFWAQRITNAVSTRREYLADACSALYTRYPEGLASALQKIAASTEQLKAANMTTATLYIINPFREKGMAASNVTETHPPISERIGILRSMARISYIDYDLAYREIRGTNISVLPDYAIAAADSAPIRSPQPDDMDDIQRARETSNVLWNLNSYKLITCDCGTKMRLPPSFKLSEVRCPHCGKVLAV
jgi:heat shock protein HtpX